ncbi:MAG: hypothetical protein JWP52_4253 [Rhizobacter sp.]|nr:hypothetical protein [Rhizobacter sp.]
MADVPDFTKMVPGFDFLQGLVKNAGAALPGIGQWVAPTLDPQELEKRISELRTVQFWLEQNARLLGTTIQALEVQRMTLSTLKTMNVQMGDLRESMSIRPQASAPASPFDAAAFSFGAGSAATPAAASAAAPPSSWMSGFSPAAEPASPSPADPSAPAGATSSASDNTTANPAAPPAVDPMQWWGALTQQFATLAATAIKDGASEASRTFAGITAAADSAATASHAQPPTKKTASAKPASSPASKPAARSTARAAAAPGTPARKSARTASSTPSRRTSSR